MPVVSPGALPILDVVPAAMECDAGGTLISRDVHNSLSIERELGTACGGSVFCSVTDFCESSGTASGGPSDAHNVQVSSFGSIYYRAPHAIADRHVSKQVSSSSSDQVVLGPRVEPPNNTRAATFLRDARQSVIVRRLGITSDRIEQVARNMNPFTTIGRHHYVDLSKEAQPEPDQFHHFF